VRALDRVGAYQGRMLEIAGQVQVVGAVYRGGDAHARSIYLVDRADRRARRDEVGRLDLEVCRAERDVPRALGLVAEERHVPGAGLDGIGELARRGERDELDIDAQPLSDLPPQVDGDARVLGLRVLGDEQEVAVVD